MNSSEINTAIDSAAQGDKVRFKRFKQNEWNIGRIEVNHYGRRFFVNEFCYQDDHLKSIYEPMQYYNSVGSYGLIDAFELITEDTP